LVISPPGGVLSIAMTVCLFVCPLAQIENHTAGLHQIFMHAARGHGSVLFQRRCDTLCTSDFVDDVIFSYHGAGEPESNTTLCFEEVRQVAVPAGHLTTAVLGRVRQNVSPGSKSAIRD